VGRLQRLCGLSCKELGRRIWDEIWDDEILGHTAELSFYILFALFPLLLCLMVLLGYLADAGTALRAEMLDYFGQVLPRSAFELIGHSLDEISENATAGKLSFGLVVALWTASTGMGAVMTTLNRAYDIDEERPYWKWRLVAIGLTLAFAAFIVVALALVLYGEHIAERLVPALREGGALAFLWPIGRWTLVLLFVFLAFSLTYRLAPNLKHQKLKWILPGALVGMLLWLLASFGFQMYLNGFGSYEVTYGSIGAVMVLLFWVYLTSLAILVGGEVNSVIEHAAARTGAPDARLPGEHEPMEAAMEAAAGAARGG
jgi:membrane protein